MNPDKWSTRKRVETQYSQEIENLMKRFYTKIKNLAITDPQEILLLLRQYVAEEGYRKLAFSAASRMATALFSDTAKTWKEAMKESMMGRELYAAMRKELRGEVGTVMRSIVKENAKLISTFPLDLAQKANSFIMRETEKGRRAESIAEDLMERFPKVSRSRIELIAITETAKANSALVEARAQDLDLDWYEWYSSHDSRVRPSHRLMNEVLVRWSDPPDPEALNHEEKDYGNYHAGRIFRCRCTPLPILRLDQIRFPHKVHLSGRIQMMTLSQFRELSGVRLAA
jgi:SPP1 gp7 family putative phage head morphogenesis protein